MKKIFNNKNVPNEFLGKWRSIEFELIFNSIQCLNDFIGWVEGKEYDRYITVKFDGSVYPSTKKKNYDLHLPREVVVSYRSGKDQIVYDICEFLKDKAYVNKSCGAHVHFDMREVKEERVMLLGKRLAQCVSALKLLLPQSRRNNEFCCETINSIEYGESRYAFINMLAYNKHKTIEIRGHSGTLNANKILNWIKICERIMLSKKSDEPIKTPEQLIKNYKFSEELQAYILKRAEQIKEGKKLKKSKTTYLTFPAGDVSLVNSPALTSPIQEYDY